MDFFKGIIFLFFLTMAIGFALYNDQPTSLHYYFGWESTPLPLFLWAFLALIIGIVMGGFYAVGAKFRLRTRLRHLQKSIRELEKRRMALAQKGR